MKKRDLAEAGKEETQRATLGEDVDPKTGLLANAGPATSQTVFSGSLQVPEPWFLI